MNVLVIGENGDKLGEMTLEKAKQIAANEKKSLVLVNAKANVYRICDIGKLRYEQKQKEKDQRAQKRTHKIKEVRFGLTTEQHDIDIKVRRIRGFLEEGFKTKVTMRLHGRQETLRDSGIEKMKRIIEESISGGIANVDKGPIFENRAITAYLNPTK